MGEQGLAPHVWDIAISARREAWHNFDQATVEWKIREALIGWGFDEVWVTATMADVEEQPTTPCPARRVHPISTDYYLPCVREAGHPGVHRAATEAWSDDHPWACRDTNGDPITPGRLSAGGQRANQSQRGGTNEAV